MDESGHLISFGVNEAGSSGGGSGGGVVVERGMQAWRREEQLKALTAGLVTEGLARMADMGSETRQPQSKTWRPCGSRGRGWGWGGAGMPPAFRLGDKMTIQITKQEEMQKEVPGGRR